MSAPLTQPPSSNNPGSLPQLNATKVTGLVRQPGETETAFQARQTATLLSLNRGEPVNVQFREPPPGTPQFSATKVQGLQRLPGETDQQFQLREQALLLSLNTGAEVRIRTGPKPVTDPRANLPLTETSEGPKEIIVTDKRPTPPPEPNHDWRVKLSLAPGSKYLYNAEDPGILEPLKQTNGVIFPYLPQITVNYTANYNTTDLVHSNYKVYQYANSSVDTVSITGDFTAQDTKEARYLLSVIHFFRTVTKMFFGTDETPRAGTPPPLCFLKGLGSYQFSEHPLVITNFTYTLPNDVDYIPTTGPDQFATRLNGEPVQWKSSRIPNGRLPDEILPGGQRAGPNFSVLPNQAMFNQVSYVPSKITLNISCLPVVSRAAMADKYSTEKYASGKAYLKDGGRFW